MGSFKSAVTRELRLHRLHDGSPVWQRNYYDRVVRSDVELTRIREYIAANPTHWQYDRENPSRQVEPTFDDAWALLEGASS